MDNKNNKNKFLIPILLLVLIIAAGVGGYFIGDVVKGPVDTYDEFDEIAEILNQYHYSKPSIEDLFTGAVEGMADSLDDKFTYLIKETETTNGELGISYSSDGVNYYVNNINTDSPCYKKLYRWDIIKKVNDVDVTKLNDTDFLALFGLNAGAEVKMTIQRGNSTHDFTFQMKEKNIVAHKMLDEKTGYIKLKEFSTGSAAKFQTALDSVENGIDKLIIDLRDNGGGSLEELRLILNMFVTYKSTPYLTLDNFDGTKQEIRPNINMTERKPYDIDVLVNGSSASASEAFASVMKEYMGYDIIGTQTYGKGVYQNTFELTELPGYYLSCTIGYWYTPDGNNVHGVGVTPTIKVDTYNVGMTDGFDYELDSVSSTNKNVQNMLKLEGYTGRSDGYFDSTLENYLDDNYNSTAITEEIYYNIYENYLDNLLNNDPFIDAAIQ